MSARAAFNDDGIASPQILHPRSIERPPLSELPIDTSTPGITCRRPKWPGCSLLKAGRHERTTTGSSLCVIGRKENQRKHR